MTIALPPAQALDIRGADAVAFAHAQFSSDVRALAVGTWQWSAWLSAQGRVRALFRLLRNADDSLRALLSGGSAAEFQRQLSPFVLRAKVRLEAGSESALGTFDEGEIRELLGNVPTGQALVEGGDRIGLTIAGSPRRWLVLGPADAAERSDGAQFDRWRRADILAGIVDLAPPLQDRYVPAALGLDRLGAISLRKGCYPGQEIVARLHFKGGNKRRLHRLEFDAPGRPEPGVALVTAEGVAAGELLQAAPAAGSGIGIALAVLSESAAGTELTALSGGVTKFRVVSVITDASD